VLLESVNLYLSVGVGNVSRCAIFLARIFVENETRFSQKYHCKSRETNWKVEYLGEIEESKSYSKHLEVMHQETRWVLFVKKNRGWKSRETITLREPQFCFKLCYTQYSRKNKISIDSRESCFKISVCETRQKWVSLSLTTKFVCETREKRVSLRNFNLWDSYELNLTMRFLSTRLVRSKSRY
jgi:hypothetical protein